MECLSRFLCCGPFTGSAGAGSRLLVRVLGVTRRPQASQVWDSVSEDAFG